MSDIKENKLRPYTIVTGQDVEKFEEGVNHLLELGYALYGNVQTSSVLGKGDIITVYTQVMVEGGSCEDTECSNEKCETNESDKTEDSETPSADKTEVETEENNTNDKELLVEPANATKKTGKKQK